MRVDTGATARWTGACVDLAAVLQVEGATRVHRAVGQRLWRTRRRAVDTVRDAQSIVASVGRGRRTTLRTHHLFIATQ